MPKKILFLSKGQSSSATRYRALQYFPYFNQADWAPQHIAISGGLIGILSALYSVKNADVVVLLRKTFPYPLFWILRKVSKKLVFDFDDAIFCNTDGTHSQTRMQRFVTTTSNCDAVFAGNKYLADEAKKNNPNVEIIPTSVDVEKYNLPNKKNNGTIDLVWIGSSSTKKYIAEIVPYLESATETIPNLRLKIIADFELVSSKLLIQNIRWDEQSEASELCNSDIGLAPMPENDWTKGKCALKVLQYMAAGLPVISSASGANKYIVENGVSGYLVPSYDLWCQAIIKLSKDNASLNTMGKKGKERTFSEFSIHVVFKQMLQVINSF